MNNETTNATRIWESAWPPGLQFAFGVIGNFIALIILCMSSKRHKWKPFYRLVGGLAITDMCGVLFVYPSVMVRYATDFTYDFPRPLCQYSSFIFTFALLSSALIVCAMSFDRFLAIIFPFYYNSETKIRRVNIMLISIWSFTLFISCLHLWGLGDSKNFYPGSWCFLNFVGRTTKDRINSFIYSVIGIIILVITVVLNVSVMVTVCRNFVMSKRPTLSKRRGKKNNMYIIVFLFVIVTVFSSCWMPLMINILQHATLQTDANGTTELLVLRFAVTNSIIDPWIYILLRKETLEFLIKMKNNLKKKLGYRVPEEGPRTTDVSTSDSVMKIKTINLFKAKTPESSGDLTTDSSILN